MSRLGIALRSISLDGTDTGASPYLIVYFGTEAAVRDGQALLAISRPLEGLRPGGSLSFDDLGLLLVPPVEVGEMIAWRVEVWKSDTGHRAVGDLLKAAAGKVNMNSEIVRALLHAGSQAALSAIQEVAGSVETVLCQGGDELLYTWAGSLLAGEMQDDCVIERGNEVAHLTFQFFSTEEGGTARVPIES